MRFVNFLLLLRQQCAVQGLVREAQLDALGLPQDLAGSVGDLDLGVFTNLGS
eukprot:COSAG05_NODE_5419_length_1179_cov_1.873148_2_plen_52_part_00